ncbi:hypothetical protein Sjap_021999 [Stephania japonica]|uniref:Uncharacterized protein n=1 Tax=Stephania japonica TaxID=461633 RepID=A0AAP0ER58_9MAGN
MVREMREVIVEDDVIDSTPIPPTHPPTHPPTFSNTNDLSEGNNAVPAASPHHSSKFGTLLSTTSLRRGYDDCDAPLPLMRFTLIIFSISKISS